MTAITLPHSAPRLRGPVSLAESPRLRLVTIFLLYVAQGLPFGLFTYAVPAWLAQNGVGAGPIGTILALIMVPWTFKLAYAPLMDRYAFLAMGRRRPWIIAGQLGLVAALAATALADPGPQDLALFAALAFVAGLASAVQDVAVDGLAVDILPESEVERVNAWMFGGQTIGISLAAGLGGYLMAWRGLPAAMLAMAGVTSAILLLVVALRERPGERLLPWSAGAASLRSIDLHLGQFRAIFRQLGAEVLNRRSLVLVPALVAITVSQGIFLGMAPVFAADQLGWEKDLFSSWSSMAKLTAGIVAVLCFGYAATRWGARRMFIVCALLLAAVPAAMLAGQDLWGDQRLLVVTIFAMATLSSLRGVAAGALSMRQCRPAVAATQFALYMGFLNLGATLGGILLGPLDALGGTHAMLWAMTLFSLLAAFCGAAAKVGR